MALPSGSAGPTLPDGHLPYTRLPMATTQRDYYEILGVARSATDEELKKAFRTLAQRWHPDVNTTPEAAEQFKEINEAYQVLSDPQRRQAYDLFGRAGLGNGAEGFGRVRRLPGLRRHVRRVLRRDGARRDAPGPALAGADLRYDLRLTFDEAVHGTEKEIEYHAPVRCETCGGSGAEAGTSPDHLPAMRRQRRDPQGAPTMLGQMVTVGPCPRCGGRGAWSRRPATRAAATAAWSGKRTLRVIDPRRHRRRPPDPALGRGRGRPTGRRRRQPVRRGPRRRPSAPRARGHGALRTARGIDQPGGARGPASSCRRRTARRPSRSSPGHSRAPRSGCAAGACHICGRRGSRRPAHPRRRARADPT